MRESERKEYTKAINAILEIHYTCNTHKKCCNACKFHAINKCGLSEQSIAFGVPSTWHGDQEAIQMISEYCSIWPSCAVCLLHSHRLCPLQCIPYKWDVNDIVNRWQARQEEE